MGKSRTFHGCVYAADVNDDGTLKTGKWEYLGEVFPIVVTMGQEVIKITGATCLTQGKTIGTKTKPAESGGKMSLFDYTASNVSKALAGMVSTRAVSASTITELPVTLGNADQFVDIGTEDLSDVVVKDAATDSITYAVNVDYSINPALGLIAKKDGGAIPDGAVVHITAAGAANTDQRVSIGAGASKKVALKGNLIDDFEQTEGKFYLRKVLLVSTNDVTIVSDPETEREQLDFDMVPEIPIGQSDYGTFDGLPL